MYVGDPPTSHPAIGALFGPMYVQGFPAYHSMPLCAPQVSPTLPPGHGNASAGADAAALLQIPSLTLPRRRLSPRNISGSPGAAIVAYWDWMWLFPSWLFSFLPDQAITCPGKTGSVELPDALQAGAPDTYRVLAHNISAQGPRRGTAQVGAAPSTFAHLRVPSFSALSSWAGCDRLLTGTAFLLAATAQVVVWTLNTAGDLMTVVDQLWTYIRQPAPCAVGFLAWKRPTECLGQYWGTPDVPPVLLPFGICWDAALATAPQACPLRGGAGCVAVRTGMTGRRRLALPFRFCRVLGVAWSSLSPDSFLPSHPQPASQDVFWGSHANGTISSRSHCPQSRLTGAPECSLTSDPAIAQTVPEWFGHSVATFLTSGIQSGMASGVTAGTSGLISYFCLLLTLLTWVWLCHMHAWFGPSTHRWFYRPRVVRHSGRRTATGRLPAAGNRTLTTGLISGIWWALLAQSSRAWAGMSAIAYTLCSRGRLPFSRPRRLYGARAVLPPGGAVALPAQEQACSSCFFLRVLRKLLKLLTVPSGLHPSWLSSRVSTSAKSGTTHTISYMPVGCLGTGLNGGWKGLGHGTGSVPIGSRKSLTHWRPQRRT